MQSRSSFIRWLTENRIRAAIKKNDLKKLREWLAVANQGKADASNWNYKFYTKDPTQHLSLPEVIAQESDKQYDYYRTPRWYKLASTRRQALFSSQRGVQTAVSIWKEVQSHITPPAPKLKWYQRLIVWASKKFKNELPFAEQNPFTDENMTNVFQKHLVPKEQYETDVQPIKTANFPSGFKKGVGSIETPAIREKFSVKKTIERTFRSEKTISPLLTDEKKPAASLPTDWVKSLTLNFLIDEKQQEQQQQLQNQDQEVKIAFELSRKRNYGLNWTEDTSTQFFEYTETGYAIKALGSLFDPSVLWLVKIKTALGADERTFSISENALNVIKKSAGSIRAKEHSFSLNELPLGFYITEEIAEEVWQGTKKPIKKFILKFSPSYREHQLKTVKDAALRLDPYAVATSGEATEITFDNLFFGQNINLPKVRQMATSWEEQSNPQAFHQKLVEKEITLTPEQQVFVEEQGSATIRALYCIADQASSNHLLSFINILIQMKNRNFQYRAIAKYDSKKHKPRYTNVKVNLFENFSIFLLHLINGAEFDNLECMQALQRLTQLSDDELSWFYQLTNATPPSGDSGHLGPDTFGIFEGSSTNAPINYHPDFLEVTKALYYFIDYFKDNNIPLSSLGHLQYDIHLHTGITKLKGILDCIIHSENPAVQAQMMTGIINISSSALANLKAGYCLVSDGMKLGGFGGMSFDYSLKHALSTNPNLDPESDQFMQQFSAEYPDLKDIDHHYVLPDIFKKIQYKPETQGKFGTNRLQNAWFYEAMFLRYLAFNTDSACVQQGLSKWREVIYSSGKKGFVSLEDTDKILAERWQELQAFALSFPTKMSKNRNAKKSQETSDAFVIRKAEQQTVRNQQYIASDLERLLNQLNSSATSNNPVLTDEDKETLRKDIKTLNQLAKKYSELSDDQLIEAMRRAKSDLSKGVITPIECLALMREFRYAQSGKKREWLRLEQAVAILLALHKGRLFQIDTSEGKTLIIQFIALLKAMTPKNGAHRKVDIVTHNEVLAKDSFESLRPLACALGIKLSTKGSAANNILEADIHLSDIGTVVINKRIAQILGSESKEIYPGSRQASDVLVDEVDNITIDVHASTTMQFSRGEQEEADEHLEKFLMLLNDAAEHLIQELQKGKLVSQEERREFMRALLLENQYYKDFCAHDTNKFDMWIAAAYTRAHPQHGLIRGEDYTIEPKDPAQEYSPDVVRIVHKVTTGRIDKKSHWGAGVHQCVAAFEKRNNARIEIPALSHVMGEGDIKHYLQGYESRSGFSGTLGEPAVQSTIESIMGVEAPTVIMPRAKRPTPEDANWPRIPAQDKKTEERYNRSYTFPPKLLATKAEHAKCILNALQEAQEQDYSSIVFLSTINECEAYKNYLIANGINLAHIQVLDDTNPPDETANNIPTDKFRPPESLVILNACKPKMINLTTIAGSRGTNFKGIDVEFITKPGIKRVIDQELGRIGRAGELGVKYEIYCAEDLGGMDQVSKSFANVDEKNYSSRFFVTPWEEQKQALDLNKIKNREGLRAYKEKVQAEYLERRRKEKDLTQLDKEWISFFGEIDMRWKTGLNNEENNAAMDKFKDEKMPSLK